MKKHLKHYFYLLLFSFPFFSCDKSCKDVKYYHLISSELKAYTSPLTHGNWFEYTTVDSLISDSLYFDIYYNQHNFTGIDCDEYEIIKDNAISVYQHFITGIINFRIIDDSKSFFSLKPQNSDVFKSCYLCYDKKIEAFYTNDTFTETARIIDTTIDNKFYPEMLINDQAGCGFAKNIGIIFYISNQDTFILKKYLIL